MSPPMDDTGWTSVAEALNDLAFPATKHEILDHALDKRADHAALRLLRQLPVETYRDLTAVRGAVPRPPADPDPAGAPDQAR